MADIGEASIVVRYDMTQLQQELGKVKAVVGQQMGQIESNLTKVGQQAGGGLRKALSGLELPVTQLGGALAGLGAANVFGGIIKTAADFESKMNRVGSLIDEITDDQMARMTEQATKLGASTSFSASEAATAMQELAAAGFDAEQIMSAVPGVMDLAAAAQVDLGTAAKQVGDTMQQFGLTVADVSRINDVLAQTANDSSASIEEVGNALKYAGPGARAAGISMEETAAALGVLANAGIRGEQAGTSLRSMLATLKQMEDPPKRIRAVMEKTGITFADVDTKTKSLSEILAFLSTRLTGGTDTLDLFGLEASSAAEILAKGGDATGKFAAGLENINGVAQKVGEANMAGAMGAIRAFQGAWESLQLRIADSGILDSFTSIVKVLGSLIDKVSQVSPVILEFGGSFIGIAALIAPIATVLGGLVFVAGTVAAPVLAAGLAIAALGAAALTFHDDITAGFTGAKQRLTDFLASWDGTFQGLATPLQNLGGTISGALSAAGAQLTGWVASWKQPLLAAVSSLSPEIALQIDGWLASLGGALTRVKDGLVALIGPAFAAIVNTAKAALNPFAAAADGISKQFETSFAGGIGAAAGAVLGAMVRFGTDLAAKAREAVATWFSTWNVEVGARDFGAVLNGVIDTLAGIVGRLASIGVTSVQNFGASFLAEIDRALGTDALGAVQRGLAAISQAFAGGLTGFDPLALAAPFREAAGAIGAALDGIRTRLLGWVESWREPLLAAMATFDAATFAAPFHEAGSSIATALGDISTRILGWVVSWREPLLTAISALSPELALRVDGWLASFGDAITRLRDAILPLVTGTFGAIIEAVRAALNPFANIGTEITAAFGRSFGEGLGLAVGSILGALVNFGTTLTAKISRSHPGGSH